jgi:hypothetical protein
MSMVLQNKGDTSITVSFVSDALDRMEASSKEMTEDERKTEEYHIKCTAATMYAGTKLPFLAGSFTS